MAIYRDGVQVRNGKHPFRGRFLQTASNPEGSKNSSRNVVQIGKKFYFTTPLLQLVVMDGSLPVFPERALLTDVEDFLVDENQTITYLTSQGELIQENVDNNTSIPRTCVTLNSQLDGVVWTCVESVVLEKPYYVVAGHTSKLGLTEFTLYDAALTKIHDAHVSLFNPVSRMKALPMPQMLDYRLIYFAVQEHMDISVCIVRNRKLFLLLDTKKILTDRLKPLTSSPIPESKSGVFRLETQILEVVGENIYFGGPDMLKRIVFKY